MAGPTRVPIKVFHLFGAIGGGAMGFKRGKARVGNLEADFQCLGSVDIDAAANRDFARLVGVPATTLDLMDREQYLAFHGRQPPAGWREATPQDLQRAAQNQRPNIVFLSAPCKGFSGLLSETKSKTDKYQALNRLTLRGVWLMLEAWADDPPELVLFENVPRLATRGRPLLDRITAMLRAYGYATAETTHDCGEIGGLAQSRKRFLLVARHLQKVPGLLYEPPRRPLRAVGEVLGRMPLPGAPEGGPMHRVPALQWKTWLRLAFVEAGSDWRSLNKLAVVDGHLRDYLVVPEMHHGAYGVRAWHEPSGTVAGASRCSNGAFSVDDPRGPHEAAQYQQYGVLPWHQPSGTVTAQSAPGGGTHSVADPRCPGTLHNNAFRVVRYTEPARAVTGGQGAVGGCVADPRPSGPAFCKYGVTSWQAAAGTIISGSTTGQGAYAVADPRSGMAPQRGAYLTGGHYGVTEWGAPAGAVSSAACHDNGRWSVADPRATQAQAPELVPPGCGMPAGDDKLVAVIRAMDGTWHRPFTTLELAALQSLFDPEDPAEMAAFMLDGSSDSAWRERIGNAVPRAAAEAMAGVFGQCLLLAWSGEAFQLSSAPVWVRPMVAALQVARGGAA
jgi:site-specific DNA-cytosine methylase